jgi:hypothetical protein
VPYWYHGTTEQIAKVILEKGFRPATYFGKHMEDALNFGGAFVFEVFFETDPSANWQWRNSETIPPSDIHCLFRLAPTVLHWNPEVAKRQRLLHLHEEFPGAELCETCEGRGQLEEYPPLVRWPDRPKVTPCATCHGYGALVRWEQMQEGSVDRDG